MSPERELGWLTTKLGLSEAQQGEIKPLLVTKAEQLKMLHANTTLTNDQMHEQIKALLKSTNLEIESFLNPSQVQTFKQLL